MSNNIENLIPNSARTPEQLKEITTKGGIASGVARREKKLMSQILSDYLDRDKEIIDKNGLKKKMTGPQLIEATVSKIMARGDSASVAMMKLLHEATEGQKINLTTSEGRKKMVDYMDKEDVENAAEQLDETDITRHDI